MTENGDDRVSPEAVREGLPDIQAVPAILGAEETRRGSVSEQHDRFAGRQMVEDADQPVPAFLSTEAQDILSVII